MRWLLALLVFAATAALGHFVVLQAIPAKIMATAMERMAERGVPMNQWTASPRMTPQTQTIVRPSPDLFYALCRFETADGPVLITAPGWEGYGSLSIFDRRTNNVFVASLDGQDAAVLLLHPKDKGASPEGLPDATETVFLDGPGLALIRRLAPSQDAHDLALSLADGAICDVVRDR